MDVTAIYTIWLPAGTCASSAVSAAPSRKGAQQTFARVGITHSSVNKAFHFDSAFFDLPYLLKGKFSSRYHPAYSMTHKPSCTVYTVYTHLRAAV